ncbi:hypothetical protein LXM56_13575 [Lysinibacillus fusiformis]|uniref:hypothetical protein n=1 Tax=Lysinibacillus fusiformis TaxID=28031 RepID=UPI001E2BC2A7|nr:hypothetical protein [Lysinibacillus fusiformis]MCE4045164.1 hypothetical protein [Lysinibacillus fusiformis]
MDNLIYYPSFFIEDEEWLKFGLLYMRNVNTIVPEDADNQLSSIHYFILDETDFLTSYRPDNFEIERATEIVLERIDKRIKRQINKYRGYSNGYNRPNDFEIYSTSSNQNFELFRSKFSFELEEYLKESGFAKETHNGVLIADDIGKEYMSILANEIASRNNMHLITDLKEHRNMNTIIECPTRRMYRRNEEINAVKGFLHLSIPKGLKEIPLEEIIELRNSPSYQRKLNEFQNIVDKIFNEPNYEITENTIYDIHNNLYESKKGLTAELLNLGITLVETAIGVSSTLNNPISLEALREVLGGRTILESWRPLYSRYQNNRNRRLATSFVTDIKNLQRRPRYS